MFAEQDEKVIEQLMDSISRKYESEIENLKLQIKKLTEGSNSSNQQKKNLDDSFKSEQNTSFQLAKEKAELEFQNGRLNQELAELKSRLNAYTIQNKMQDDDIRVKDDIIDELRKNEKDISAELSTLRNNLKNFQVKNEELNGQIESLMVHNSDLQEVTEQFMKRDQQFVKQVKELTLDISKKSEEIDTLKTQLDKLKKDANTERKIEPTVEIVVKYNEEDKKSKTLEQKHEEDKKTSIFEQKQEEDKKISMLEQKHEEAQGRIKQLENSVLAKSKQNEELNELVEKMEHEIKQLKGLNNDYMQELNKLSMDIIRKEARLNVERDILLKETERKKEEYEFDSKRVSKLEAIIGDKENELLEAEKTILRLENKEYGLSEAMVTIKKQAAALNVRNRHISELVLEVNTLTKIVQGLSAKLGNDFDFKAFINSVEKDYASSDDKRVKFASEKLNDYIEYLRSTIPLEKLKITLQGRQSNDEQIVTRFVKKEELAEGSDADDINGSLIKKNTYILDKSSHRLYRQDSMGNIIFLDKDTDIPSRRYANISVGTDNDEFVNSFAEHEREVEKTIVLDGSDNTERMGGHLDEGTQCKLYEPMPDEQVDIDSIENPKEFAKQIAMKHYILVKTYNDIVCDNKQTLAQLDEVETQYLRYKEKSEKLEKEIEYLNTKKMQTGRELNRLNTELAKYISKSNITLHIKNRIFFDIPLSDTKEGMHRKSLVVSPRFNIFQRNPKGIRCRFEYPCVIAEFPAEECRRNQTIYEEKYRESLQIAQRELLDKNILIEKLEIKLKQTKLSLNEKQTSIEKLEEKFASQKASFKEKIKELKDASSKSLEARIREICSSKSVAEAMFEAPVTTLLPEVSDYISTLKHENQCHKQRITELGDMMSYIKKDIEFYKQRCKKLEDEREELGHVPYKEGQVNQEYLYKLQRSNVDLKKRVAFLSDQNEQLKAIKSRENDSDLVRNEKMLLAESKNQISRLKLKINEMENKYSDLKALNDRNVAQLEKEKMQGEKLKQILSKKEKTLQELTDKYNKAKHQNEKLKTQPSR